MGDAVNEEKLQALMGQMVGHMTGAALCVGVWLGDELGLYRELAKGAQSADGLAKATRCHARLVREWLDGQAAGGLVTFDAGEDLYGMTPEARLALADDESPVFVARAMNTLRALFMDGEKVAAAFRGDGALAWGDHHPCLFSGTEWFFRTGYRANLPTSWIPALEGVKAKLERGARVADVGCGHGASSIVLAQAFPKARVTGYDVHAPSVATATRRAAEAGVSDRATFATATAKDYGAADERFDLICFFDCLHDMGDPVGAARHALARLAPDGTVLLVEPFALDGRADNVPKNPMAALLYTASATICTPNSLSQEVKLGLGAQAGEARLRRVFEEAGFTRFRRAAATPLNLILEARA